MRLLGPPANVERLNDRTLVSSAVGLREYESPSIVLSLEERRGTRRLTPLPVLVATLHDFIETRCQSGLVEAILYYDDLRLLEELPYDVLVCLCCNG